MNSAMMRTMMIFVVPLTAAGLGGDAAPRPRCGDLPDDGGPTDGSPLTPYPAMADDGFLRGATVDLNDLRRDRTAVEDRLRTMRDRYRLEAYDPETFAFTAADADRLLDGYAALMADLAAPERRQRVAYLAVNMPLDDPRVQARLGGVNAPLSIERCTSGSTSTSPRAGRVPSSTSD